MNAPCRLGKRTRTHSFGTRVHWSKEPTNENVYTQGNWCVGACAGVRAAGVGLTVADDVSA